MLKRLLRLISSIMLSLCAAILAMIVVGTQLPRGEWLAWTGPTWHLRAGETVETSDVFLWDRGSVVNLTKNSATDSAPAWSRDGRLAWVSNRDGNHDVFVLHNGAAVNISQSDWGIGGFVWSDDGRLAWVAWNAANGWPGETIHIWDGASVQRVSQESSVDWPIAWLADGRLRWSGWSNEEPPVRYIYTWAGSDTQSAAIDLPNVGNFSWARDGGVALVVLDGFSADSVFVSRADADDAPALIYSEYGMTANIAWSSDGRLAWVEVQAPGSVRIVVWDDGATTLIPVSDAPRTLAWSDHGHLAWADGSGSGRWGIKVWDGQTTTVVQQGLLLATPPRWSPGGHLAWGATNGREWHVSVWDGVRTYRASPLGLSANDPVWVGG
jgi:tricorn protease-like protein